MFGNALGWWILCLLKHNVCCQYNTVSWHPWGFGGTVYVNGHIFSILLQWGLNSIGTNTTVNLPTSFSSTSYTLVNNYDNIPTALFPAKVTRQSKTSFAATANYGGNPVTTGICWFAIGI